MSIQERTANKPRVSAFKRSRFGIVSLIIALLDLLYFILFMFFWRYIGENSILYKVIDQLDYSNLSLVSWCFVAFLGIAFCLIGVKKDQKKIFSFLGLLLGAPVFWFLFMIMVFETNLMPEALR